MRFLRSFFRFIKNLLNPVNRTAQQINKKTGAALSASELQNDVKRCATESDSRKREAAFAATAIVWREKVAMESAKAASTFPSGKTLDRNTDPYWEKLLRSVENRADKNGKSYFGNLSQSENRDAENRFLRSVLSDMKNGFQRAKAEIRSLQQKNPKDAFSAVKKPFGNGDETAGGGKSVQSEVKTVFLYPPYFVSFLPPHSDETKEEEKGGMDWMWIYRYFLAYLWQQTEKAPQEKSKETIGQPDDGIAQEQLKNILSNQLHKKEISPAQPNILQESQIAPTLKNPQVQNPQMK